MADQLLLSSQIYGWQFECDHQDVCLIAKVFTDSIVEHKMWKHRQIHRCFVEKTEEVDKLPVSLIDLNCTLNKRWVPPPCSRLSCYSESSRYSEHSEEAKVDKDDFDHNNIEKLFPYVGMLDLSLTLIPRPAPHATSHEILENIRPIHIADGSFDQPMVKCVCERKTYSPKAGSCASKHAYLRYYGTNRIKRNDIKGVGTIPAALYFETFFSEDLLEQYSLLFTLFMLSIGFHVAISTVCGTTLPPIDSKKKTLAFTRCSQKRKSPNLPQNITDSFREIKATEATKTSTASMSVHLSQNTCDRARNIISQSIKHASSPLHENGFESPDMKLRSESRNIPNNFSNKNAPTNKNLNRKVETPDKIKCHAHSNSNQLKGLDRILRVVQIPLPGTNEQFLKHTLTFPSFGSPEYLGDIQKEVVIKKPNMRVTTYDENKSSLYPESQRNKTALSFLSEEKSILFQESNNQIKPTKEDLPTVFHRRESVLQTLRSIISEPSARVYFPYDDGELTEFRIKKSFVKNKPNKTNVLTKQNEDSRFKFHDKQDREYSSTSWNSIKIENLKLKSDEEIIFAEKMMKSNEGKEYIAKPRRYQKRLNTSASLCDIYTAGTSRPVEKKSLGETLFSELSLMAKSKKLSCKSIRGYSARTFIELPEQEILNIDIGVAQIRTSWPPTFENSKDLLILESLIISGMKHAKLIGDTSNYHSIKNSSFPLKSDTLENLESDIEKRLIRSFKTSNPSILEEDVSEYDPEELCKQGFILKTNIDASKNALFSTQNDPFLKSYRYLFNEKIKSMNESLAVGYEKVSDSVPRSLELSSKSLHWNDLARSTPTFIPPETMSPEEYSTPTAVQTFPPITDSSSACLINTTGEFLSESESEPFSLSEFFTAPQTKTSSSKIESARTSFKLFSPGQQPLKYCRDSSTFRPYLVGLSHQKESSKDIFLTTPRKNHVPSHSVDKAFELEGSLNFIPTCVLDSIQSIDVVDDFKLDISQPILLILTLGRNGEMINIQFQDKNGVLRAVESKVAGHWKSF